MRWVAGIVGAVLLLGVGFAAGYAYNETVVCRVAISAAKAVAGKAKTAIEESCEERPDLKRCALLKLRRPVQE